MLYLLENGAARPILPKEVPECAGQGLLVGVITARELEKLAPYMGISPIDESELVGGTQYFRGCVEVYDTYTFGRIKPSEQERDGTAAPIAFFLFERGFVVVSLAQRDVAVEQRLSGALRRFPPHARSLEKIVFAFFSGFTEGESKYLEDLEFAFSRSEEELLCGEPPADFTGRLLRRKQRLLLLHHYYEQLIDVGQALAADENDLFAKEELRYFKIFTNKVQRLSETVELLRRQLEYSAAAYRSLIDLNLNRIMKAFTALSALFLPLTFLTGWYGMNFSHMPELTWRYGYPALLTAAALLVLGLLWIFKKRRWL